MEDQLGFMLGLIWVFNSFGMMKWSRVRVRLEPMRRSDDLGKAFYCRYVIDQFHGQPSNVLKILSQYQLKVL